MEESDRDYAFCTICPHQFIGNTHNENTNNETTSNKLLYQLRWFECSLNKANDAVLKKTHWILIGNSNPLTIAMVKVLKKVRVF